MKKLLLVLVAVMGLTFAANAQKAIGVRLGGGQGYGAELSFQKGLGGVNRLEADLGYYGYYGVASFGLSALYQIHQDIAAVPNLGWYAGVGARLCYWSWEAGHESDSDIALGLAGQAGIEYKFSAIPIQLSLDIRPCFYLIPDTHFHWGDIALGIRYCF